MDNVLCAILFVALAGISLTAVALVSIIVRTRNASVQAGATRLSQLNPPEYRSVGYLFLSFLWCVIGLLLALVFSLVVSLAISIGGTNSSWYWAITILNGVLIGLVLILVLSFLYAGAGHLLRSMLSQEGALIRQFFPPIRHYEELIVRFGDYMTRGLFQRRTRQGNSNSESDTDEGD